MDITTLKTVFGPSPIALLSTAQLAQKASDNNKMLLIGGTILIVSTVVVTIYLHKKYLEEHPIKVVQKPAFQNYYNRNCEE